jgi:Cytochrome P460
MPVGTGATIMKMRVLMLAGLGAAALLGAAAAAEQAYEIAYVGEDGITVPDYGKWVFIGSDLGMSYTGETRANPPFSNVFAEPSAYDSFMENGVWPDRTVLLSEHRASATNLSINKAGFVQTGPAMGVELEVKDAAKGGWTFYMAPSGATTAKALPRSMACYACHAEHAAVDNTFVQFYPTLIEVAKRKGTFKEATK